MMTRPLATINTASLTAELTRRQRLLPGLQRRHDRLMAQARSLAAEIEAMGGTVNGAVRGGPGRRRDGSRRRTGSGRRGPRAGSLVSILLEALRGKTMTVTEAVAAVRKAGFKTKATPTSFYHAVATALARSGRFRKIARGRYTAKA